MSRALKGGDEEALLQVRREAEQLGSYASAPSEELFDRQRNLLSEGVVERIQKADAELFRFPGMLGAVSPLFPLLNS